MTTEAGLKESTLEQEKETSDISLLPEKSIQREIRDTILHLEKVIGSIPGAVIGDSSVCPLKHSFADGVYVREIFIPKNTLLVGKIHRHSHPNFLMKGDVSVLTEEGPRRIKAPCSMVSPAGTKRAVFAHEDTVWVTVHVVGEERDLDKIEDFVIAKTYRELGINSDQELIEITEQELVKFIEHIKTDGGDL